MALMLGCRPHPCSASGSRLARPAEVSACPPAKNEIDSIFLGDQQQAARDSTRFAKSVRIAVQCWFAGLRWVGCFWFRWSPTRGGRDQTTTTCCGWRLHRFICTAHIVTSIGPPQLPFSANLSLAIGAPKPYTKPHSVRHRDGASHLMYTADAGMAARSWMGFIASSRTGHVDETGSRSGPFGGGRLTQACWIQRGS